jgi:hypothetical protein
MPRKVRTDVRRLILSDDGVEAIQYDPEKIISGVEHGVLPAKNGQEPSPVGIVRLHQGKLVLYPGQWLVRGIRNGMACVVDEPETMAVMPKNPGRSSIRQLGLPRGTEGNLRSAGIRTIDQLRNETLETLLEIPYIGQRTIDMIERTMVRNGFPPKWGAKT